MIIKYRSHTFTVPDSDLIVMGDSFYAKVDLGQRGQSFPHYIKVTPPVAEVGDPRLTGMVYCYPAIPQNFDSGLDYCYPQPAPLTVVLTPEMAANVNASALVSIVVRKPVISLWADGLRVA